MVRKGVKTGKVYTPSPFVPLGKEAMPRKPLSLKVEAEIYNLIQKLPNRSSWMRKVITEAALRELK